MLLDVNYRSRQGIVDTAARLIAHNKMRFDKAVRAQNRAERWCEDLFLSVKIKAGGEYRAVNQTVHCAAGYEIQRHCDFIPHKQSYYLHGESSDERRIPFTMKEKPKNIYEPCGVEEGPHRLYEICLV